MFLYMSLPVSTSACLASCTVFVASLFAVPVALSAPLISEFCPDNETIIADSDGDFPDWIEIHNPDTTTVDLGGYALTDNDSSLQKWVFPAGVMLDPGAFLIVFASDKDRTVAGSELHTNFKLSAGGEYLALVDPVGVVVHEFAPEYPPLLEDQSFGAVFGTRDLLPPGAPAETLVPLDGSLGTTWTPSGFVSGPEWIDGEAGAGFGLKVPGIGVRQVFSTVPIQSIADADALLADDGTGMTTTVLSEERVISQTVNFLSNGNAGNFDGNVFFPGGTGNNFALEATGTIVIPTSGDWTFGSSADDGARVRINGVDVILVGNLSSFNYFGTINLAAGVYPFEYTHYQAGGGSGAEFFAAPGALTTFDSSFRLVGDVESGGLETRTPPDGATTGSFIGTDLTAVMKDVATSAYHRVPFEVTDPSSFTSLDLSIRYSDGVVAYINGIEVYRSNVPDPVSWNSAATASRPDPLGTDLVNISSAIPLLNSGANNVLAIHGLSSPLPDAEFAIVPSLTGARPPGGEPVVFETPTPGTINFGNESFGSVLDTGFSLDRGFYPNTQTPTVPFDVAITTATTNATIYYTTDGSEPSEENGTAYTGPISITGTTTLRAIGTKPGFIPTNVDTQTYIVLDDVITQSETVPPNWPASSTAVDGQIFDYGMDPDIVNNANPEIGGVAKVKEALAAVPSLAISIPQDSLNGLENGIYTNAQKRGFEWERKASLELIYPEAYVSPDGVTDDLQIDCGLRIRGGFSRSAENPKHSFRVFFRGDYGDSKLEYPLFGSEGTDIFDGIDLRSPQNNSWSFQNSPVNTFLRDVWSRDVQRELGQPYTRSRYYHLYLNGIYWGLYQTQERAEADYAETYFGGDELDYDVVKSFGDVTDGTVDAYERLFVKWQNGFTTDAAFYDILGRDANGDIDPAKEKLIDLENLLDYMILTYFSGDRDGPGSRFTGIRPNNYFGIFDRRAPDGFKFFEHDSEHSLGVGDTNMVTPFKAAIRTGNTDPLLIDFNPHVLHQTLAEDNARYRRIFADRVDQLLAPGSPLHEDAAIALLDSRAAEIDSAIIAHSARWGDAVVDAAASPRTRADWLTATEGIRTFIRGRGEEMIEQLRAVGWYPETPTPVFSQAGGHISSTEEIFLTDTTGDIYITLDGTDPRNEDDSIAASATQFVGPTVDVDILDPGSVWKFLGSITAEVPGWQTPAFDDSTWMAAPASLGYGEPTLTSNIVDFVTDLAGNKNITTYFRTTFNLTDAASISEFNAQIRRDDGAVVYLNGTEIGRSNMPDGLITIDTRADSVIGGNDERIFFPLTLNPTAIDALVDGENVLAIEIHQESGTSSDVSFDFQAEAVRSLDATPTFLPGPGEVRVTSRALFAGEWSTVTSELFFVDLTPATSENLILTEVHYHPASPTSVELAAGITDENDFEFIELFNPSDDFVHLRGVTFTDGIDFTFDDASASVFVIAPGQRIVLVRNIVAFRLRYGNTPVIAGEYEGALNNGGETITAEGLFSLTYDDVAPWPVTADGAGDSLTYLGTGDPADPANWRASILPDGFPGEQDELTFARWAEIHGVAAVPGEDADGDGFSRLAEYALGGDPFTNDGGIGATTSAENTTLSIGYNPEAFNVHFILESSDDLVSPLYENTGIVPTIVGERLQFVLPAGAETRRFYRIRIDAP